MFGGASGRDVKRLDEAAQRADDRIESLRRDTNGMGSRLDTRIDLLAGLMQELQAQSGAEHERVMRRLDEFHDEVGERVDLIDTAVKDLTVKVGVEVGRIRTATDAIAERKRLRAEILSADFVKKYRLVVVIVVGVILLVAGGALGPVVEKLIAAIP